MPANILRKSLNKFKHENATKCKMQRNAQFEQTHSLLAALVASLRLIKRNSENPFTSKNYWIYNLISAVFFLNLNIYLRKTCTVVLFKVLPI